MTAGPFDLAGRNALVTGGNTGIGRALALALGAQGADVAVHHLGGAEEAAGAVAALRALGRRADRFERDLGERGAAAALAREALGWGPIDILVANAAVERRRPWCEVTDADLDHHVDVNLRSLLQLLQALVPPMAARGWGRVVAVGSVLGRRPRAETLVYASLKAAQLAAVRALAREVAPRGVTLNVVSPGAILTPRSAALARDPAALARAVAKIPAGRVATPADLVGPVLMLCGDGGAYVTGIDLAVDGGWSIGDAVDPAGGEAPS